MLRVTTTVSLRSASVSPCTNTVMVWLTSPGEKVKVPELNAV